MRQKRQKLLGILAAVCLALCLPLAAAADMGPKPSVRVRFENLPDQVCYGTLLSQRESTGPDTAWDGVSPFPGWGWHGTGAEDEALWAAFCAYEDADGFYFLEEWWNCSEAELAWTYYPPSPFKILLYFPESGTFCVSPIYERYAFDSYYTVDLADWESGAITAVPSYDYTQEILGGLARFVLTLAVELALAWAVYFRQRRALWFFVRVNLFTQAALNIALSLIAYQMGALAYVLFYVLLEVVVLVFEMVLYLKRLPRYLEGPVRPWQVAAYAALANGASFLVGIWLSERMPFLF